MVLLILKPKCKRIGNKEKQEKKGGEMLGLFIWGALMREWIHGGCRRGEEEWGGGEKGTGLRGLAERFSRGGFFYGGGRGGGRSRIEE